MRHLSYDLLPESPVGPVLVALDDGRLVAVAFGPTTEAGLLEKCSGRRDGVRFTRAPRAAAPAIEALRAYFAGQLTVFELPLDTSAGTPFQQAVWRATARVPYGRCATYGQIAEAIGRPGSARAVGGAMGRNPTPIVVPCHRIVAAGGIGGFTGGLRYKRALMAVEGMSP